MYTYTDSAMTVAIFGHHTGLGLSNSADPLMYVFDNSVQW